MNEDSEDNNYLPLFENEVSLSNEDFIMPEEPLEQERFKCRLIATARSLKKKQQQLQANQDLLTDRWTEVLAAEEYRLERPTKSYPKRKLLPQFDDEALEPVLPAHNAAKRTPRDRDKTAIQTEPQPSLPRQTNRKTSAQGYTHDLRCDLENRAGQTRSIYGSRGRALTHDNDYQAEHGKHNHIWADNCRWTPSKLCDDLA